MYSLSGLPATETFVLHSNNKLIKTEVTAALNQITVELAPLSVNSIILKAAPTSSDTKLQNRELKAVLYPNPASSRVNLNFSLPERGKFTIELFQANGILLKTISNETFDAGNHQIEFNTSELFSGIYWIRFRSETDVKTTKLIIN